MCVDSGRLSFEVFCFISMIAGSDSRPSSLACANSAERAFQVLRMGVLEREGNC